MTNSNLLKLLEIINYSNEYKNLYFTYLLYNYVYCPSLIRIKHNMKIIFIGVTHERIDFLFKKYPIHITYLINNYMRIMNIFEDNAIVFDIKLWFNMNEELYSIKDIYNEVPNEYMLHLNKYNSDIHKKLKNLVNKYPLCYNNLLLKLNKFMTNFEKSFFINR
jgi:hypothetical protein